MSATLLSISDTVNGPSEIGPELDLWDSFWTLYPRREAKKDAARAWSRMSEADQLEAVVAMASWRRIWAAQGRTTDKIRLPATWLNGEQWTDDIPVEFRSAAGSGATHASHMPATTQPLPEKRGEIPQHIRDQIAKLRAVR